MSKKKSFPLRINPEIHSALEKWAADELRSVNSHIEFLLRQALLNSGRLKKQQDKKQIEKSIEK